MNDGKSRTTFVILVIINLMLWVVWWPSARGGSSFPWPALITLMLIVRLMKYPNEAEPQDNIELFLHDEKYNTDDELLRIDEAKIRRFVIQRMKAAHELRIHIIFYLLVNLTTWFIWAIGEGGLTNNPSIYSYSIPWPLFVTIGWGVGLFAHILQYYFQYGRGPNFNEDKIEREVQRELERMRRRRHKE